MNHTAIIAIVVIVVIVGLVLLLKKSGSPAAPQQPPHESDGVTSAAAAALEDVAGPLLGVDAHPDFAGPPDDLTQIKGLGPKAAETLKTIGITRFAQLGALDTAQAAALDAQMGVFRGRIERDRWIEQARYLARGDLATFEKEFGKIG